jgi:hypothetical protein
MARLSFLVSPVLLAMPNDSASYDNGTVTNGSGQASGVYVTVQRGGQADIDVDFTIKTISEETFKKWKSDVVQHFTQEQKQHLQENYGAFGLAGGYFAGAFGLLFGGDDYNHYRDKQDSFHVENDDKREGFAKSVYNLSTSDFHVKGKLTAIGTSFIPVTVSVYVEITKIRFNDGKELHVLSTDNNQAAQRDGSTSGAG